MEEAAKKTESPRASETRRPRWEMRGAGRFTPKFGEGARAQPGNGPRAGMGGSLCGVGGLDPGAGGLSVGHAGRAGDAHAAAPAGSYSLRGESQRGVIKEKGG